MRFAWAVAAAVMCLAAAVGGEYTICLVVEELDKADFHASAMLATSHINTRDSSVLDVIAGIPGDFPGFRIVVVNEDVSGTVAGLDCLKAGADAIVGAATSGHSMSLAQVAATEDIPVVSYWATSDRLGDKIAYPTFSRTISSDSKLVEATIELMRHYSWEHVAVVHKDDAYGKSLGDGFRQAASRGEIKVAVVSEFSTEVEGDAVRAIGEVVESGATVIFVVMRPAFSYEIISLAKKAGILVGGYTWIVADAVGLDWWEQLVAGLPEGEDEADLADQVGGFLQVLPVELVDPGGGKFSAAWKEGGLRSPEPQSIVPSIAGYVYDCVVALALAMAEAGPQGGANVTASLRARVFHGVTGRVALDASGDRLGSEYQVNSFKRTRVSPEVVGASPVVQWAEVGRFFPPRDGEEHGSVVVQKPFTFLGGLTEAPPDGLSCPEGSVFDPPTLACAYKVSLLFPHAQSEDWMRITTAALIAAHQFNTKDSSIVPEAAAVDPGTFIAPILMDTEYNAGGGVRAAQRSLEERVLGAIGAARSAVSVPIATIFDTETVPIISYWSTSPKLSNKDEFRTFSRTIPTDDVTARVTAQFCMKLGWTRVGILFPEDDYGVNWFGAFLSEVGKFMEVVPSSYIAFQKGGESVGRAVQALKDVGTLVNIFLLFDVDVAPAFLEVDRLGMAGPGYVWLGGDIDFTPGIKPYIETDPELYAKLNRIMKGTIRTYPAAALGAGWPTLDAEFKTWSVDKIREVCRGPNCEKLAADISDIEGFFETGMGTADVGGYAYDALWTLALAVAKEEAKGNMLTSSLLDRRKGTADHIKSSSFTSVSGVVEFTESGDRKGTTVSFVLEYYDSDMEVNRKVDVYRAGTQGVPPGAYEIVWADGTKGTIPGDGASCPAGSFYSTEVFGCTTCPPGTFSPFGSSTCFECEPGTFCSKGSCALCSACPTETYQVQSRQTKCERCPAGTTTADESSVNVTNCICRAGFYRNDEATGVECFACPTGGVCDGGSLRPYPALEFWGDWALVEPGFPSTAAEARSLDRTAFYDCTKFNAPCDATCSLDLSSSALTETVKNELLRECRSVPDNLCGVGYSGRLCRVCREGFYYLGGQCQPCRSPNGLFVIGCIAGIIFSWYFLNRFAAGNYDSMDLMLIYLQVQSMISNFRLNWHDALNPLYLVFNFVNFDVDFFTPDCLNTESWDSWTYGHGLVLQIFLPQLIVLAYGMSYALKRGVNRLRPEDGFGRTISFCLKALGFPDTEEEMELALDASIAGATSFLNVVYHTVTIKSLEVFFCSELPNGHKFLHAAPEVDCWEGAHRLYVALGVLGLAGYTVGVAALWARILFHGSRNGKFAEERFQRRMGWLFMRWEREYFWWELVLLSRRGIFCFILVVGQAYPIIQAAMAFIALIYSICMHFFARPFIDTRTDKQESFQLFSLVATLIAGVLFYDKSLPLEFDLFDIREGTLVLLLTAIIGCMCNIVYLGVQQIGSVNSTATSQGVVRRATKALIIDYKDKHAHVSTPTMSARQLSSEEPVRRQAARGSSFKRPKFDSLKQDPMVADLEKELGINVTGEVDLCNTFKPHCLAALLVDVYGVETTKQVLAASKEQSARGSGSKDIDPGVLDFITKFLKLEDWTGDYLSDMSPVSYYSPKPTAMFYERAIKAMPYLVDVLLHAPDEMRDAARRFLTGMEWASHIYSDKGQYINMVKRVDQGPLVYWLLYADRSQVEVAEEIFTRMWNSSNPNDPAIQWTPLPLPYQGQARPLEDGEGGETHSAGGEEGGEETHSAGRLREELEWVDRVASVKAKVAKFRHKNNSSFYSLSSRTFFTPRSSRSSEGDGIDFEVATTRKMRRSTGSSFKVDMTGVIDDQLLVRFGPIEPGVGDLETPESPRGGSASPRSYAI